MGCDIHLYIETGYVRDNEQEPRFWMNVNGHWNPGRDYQMFAALAGVRGNLEPIVQPRGLPDNIGWRTKEDAYRSVSDVMCDCGTCSHIDRASAERHVKNGWSKVVRADKYGELVEITDCEWHTHSWLTVPEFEEAFRRREELAEDPSWRIAAEWKGVRALLRELEKGQSLRVRVVFWFDN